MKLSEAVELFGSQTNLAIRLGVTRAAVSVWKKRGIPRFQQWRLEEITKGKLRRDATHR